MVRYVLVCVVFLFHCLFNVSLVDWELAAGDGVIFCSIIY